MNGPETHVRTFTVRCASNDRQAIERLSRGGMQAAVSKYALNCERDRGVIVVSVDEQEQDE